MRKPKFLKKLAVFAAAGAMAFSLTGCCEMTLEKLMTEVDTAIADKEIHQMTMALELDANITTEGQTQDIIADVVLDVKTSSDPFATYIDMDVDADVAGESVNEAIQLYILEEEGTVVNYTHMDSSDAWTRTDTEQSVEEYEADISGDSEETLEDPADLALAEETQIVENREAYVLTCTLTGEDLSEAMGDMSDTGDVLSEMGLGDMDLDLDLTSLSVPTTVYIDMETYVPIRYECDIQGLSEVIDGLMDTMMDTMISGLTGLEGTEGLDIDTSELEAEMGAADIDIEISTAKLVLNNISYDPVEVPTVSEEGKKAAALQEIIANQYTFEADQGDGTYIIQESANAVKVTIPEGYTVYDYDYNYILATTDDESREASYYMYHNMMGQDFAFYVEQSYVPSLKEEELYVTHGIGPKIGNFETMYIECVEGIMVYYAWAPVGDGWIYVEMYDYEGAEIETVLTPILEAVEEYEL